MKRSPNKDFMIRHAALQRGLATYKTSSFDDFIVKPIPQLNDYFSINLQNTAF